MPKKYDVPACCPDAVWLLTWMPKGLTPPKSRDTPDGRKQYGPPREGWAICADDGVYVQASFCPFCGNKLDEHTETKR